MTETAKKTGKRGPRPDEPEEPKQSRLPGTEDAKVEEIQDAAITYAQIFEFSLDLQRAIARYEQIVGLCTASGCACGNCYHIEEARAAIFSVVLSHAGHDVQMFEADLPKPRKPLVPIPKMPLTGFVYLMKNNRNGYFKIGFSKNPRHREVTLQAEEPEIELVHCQPGTIADEERLHTLFTAQRVRGEWFRLSEADLEMAFSSISTGFAPTAAPDGLKGEE